MIGSDEVTAAMVAEAKTWLRVSGSALDNEVVQTLDACLLDLQAAGIRDPDLENPLIKQAAKLFCKANIGYNDKASDFELAYERLKSSLALCGDFNTTM